jgi:hypothetical protein
MSLIAAKKSNSSFKRPEPLAVGTYPARLVQVIDLGVQTRKPYKGVDKPPIQMIRCTYELVTEFMKKEDGTDDTTKPRWISEDFPFYPLSADRAKSTQRYLALDPSQHMEGDWEKLLGQAVALTVVHNPKKDDPSIVYDNIGSTSPIMKGMDVAPLVNEGVVFSLDNPDLELFASFPEFLRERIKGNLEYDGSALAAALGDVAKSATVVAKDATQETPVNPYG